MHEQGLRGVAHRWPVGLGVQRDGEGHVEVGVGVGVHGAVADAGLDHRDLRLGDHGVDQPGAAPRDEYVDQPAQPHQRLDRFVADAVQLVPGAGHESVKALMRLRGLVDVLIPRGGAGLINAVVTESQVPVIETGVGVHGAVADADADLDMALAIALNSKTRRPSGGNAAETLLVHADIAPELLPRLLPALAGAGSSRGSNSGAMSACTSRVSAALHTDGRWVLEFSAMARAMSRSASASATAPCTPTPVSITGTCDSVTTALISPAPPLGMSTSTSPRSRISALTDSWPAPGTSWTASAGRPAAVPASARMSTRAWLELAAEPDPRSSTAFPLFTHRPAASTVTLGRAS